MTENAITSNYELLKSLEATFMDGTLPSWLNRSSSGGGSTSVEAQNGGRVVLSCGTGSAGDFAHLNGELFTVGDHDAVSVEVTFKQNGPARVPGATNTGIGTYGSSGSGTHNHFINHETGARRGAIRFGGMGSETPVIKHTRGARHQPPTAVTTELLWDIADQFCIHRLQNTFAQRIDSGGNDPQSSRHFRARIETHDASVNRELYIHYVAVKYYEKKND